MCVIIIIADVQVVLRCQLVGHAAAVMACAFSPDGKLMASGYVKKIFGVICILTLVLLNCSYCIFHSFEAGISSFR